MTFPSWGLILDMLAFAMIVGIGFMVWRDQRRHLKRVEKFNSQMSDMLDRWDKQLWDIRESVLESNSRPETNGHIRLDHE